MKRATLLIAAILIAIPAVASAAGGQFTDDDGSIFESNIEWLADAGVTKGCNPPTNDLFCPSDNVSRGQMAAFMQRFAQFLGAEDGQVSSADNADTVAGMTVSEVRTDSPLVIAAADFELDGGGSYGDFYLSWAGNGWTARVESSEACLQAPVSLPNGAEMVSLHVIAGDQAGDGFYAFHTAELGDAMSLVEIEGTSTASTDPQAVAIDVAGLSPSDTSQNWIGVCLASIDDILYGATVEYVINDAPVVPMKLDLGVTPETAAVNGS